MIKPNSIFSHDWHVQPNCQRSLRVTRLSGPFWDRGPGSYAGVSSNLLRGRICTCTQPSSFLRELFEVIRSYTFKSSTIFSIVPGRYTPPRSPHSAKISKSDQQNMPEPLRLTGDKLLGPAMGLFSLGIPYRGSGALATPNPTNWLPTSLIGQALRPPGGSTAHQQLSKSSTSHSALQLVNIVSAFTRLQLPENSNTSAEAQGPQAVEEGRFLWETRGMCTPAWGLGISHGNKKGSGSVARDQAEIR